MANGQNVEICFNAADTGSCSGGDGAAIGETGTGTTLIFGSDVEDITLSDLHTRYQSITGVTPAPRPVTCNSAGAGATLGHDAARLRCDRLRPASPPSDGIAQLA